MKIRIYAVKATTHLLLHKIFVRFRGSDRLIHHGMINYALIEFENIILLLQKLKPITFQCFYYRKHCCDKVFEGTL
jgi:hypothetical protein